MENYEAVTLSRIEELKRKFKGEVAVTFFYKDQPCQLVLMTQDYAADNEMMALLGRWRQENEAWFPAQFKVTIEGTTSWFKNGVIGAKDRMLFLIRTNNEYIGHVGLFRFDFDNRTCEIDNILRGEKKYSGIMYDSIIAMMKWGAENLGLDGYTLQVLADNERAIRLYEKIGFSIVAKTPLIKIQDEHKVEWVKPPEGYTGEISRFYAVMSLTEKSKLAPLPT